MSDGAVTADAAPTMNRRAQKIAEKVAPAMERIVKAEAAAMRVTLATLLAEIGAPASSSPSNSGKSTTQT